MRRGVQPTLTGLVVGIIGLLVQFAATPARFGLFPPGIIFIVVAAILIMLTRKWWWSPLFGVAISLWIMFGGFATGKLMANLRSGDIGTVVGNTIMSVGLLAAIIGAVATILDFRRRPSRGDDTVDTLQEWRMLEIPPKSSRVTDGLGTRPMIPRPERFGASTI